jgi:hypothetical protein
MLVEANLRSGTGDGADDVKTELEPHVLGLVHGLLVNKIFNLLYERQSACYCRSRADKYQEVMSSCYP